LGGLILFCVDLKILALVEKITFKKHFVMNFLAHAMFILHKGFCKILFIPIKGTVPRKSVCDIMT
jgi:hypothetical protein